MTQKNEISVSNIFRMGSDTEPVVEDVSADEAKAAMQRQATQQAQVKSIINSIDIEGPDLFNFSSSFG